jgi:hypothetical protein
MRIKIEKVTINYKGKKVKAKKLNIASELPINIDTAWLKVKSSALLEFVTIGKIQFKPSSGHFPAIWKEGNTVTTKMVVFGFVPFGGLHSLYFERIDDISRVLQTREWDAVTKVWDHKISLQKLTDRTVLYEDEIIIYAGILSNVVTLWAKSFYVHRQKRWLLVAANPRII